MSDKLKKYFNVLFIGFALFSVAALILATYLILYSIDPTTNFYYDNAKMVPATNILLLAATLFMIVPFFIRKVKIDVSLKNQKNTVLGVFSAITAAALVVGGICSMGTTIAGGTQAGPFIIGGSEVLAAVFFILAAVSELTGRNFDLRAAALLPVLWGIINLIITFMGLTQIANISEYLYEVLQMVFALLFLYYNARIVSGLTNGREVLGGFAFGLPCAFYGLLASIPPFVAHLINNNVGSIFMPGDFVYLAISLYSIVLLLTVLKRSKN